MKTPMHFVVILFLGSLASVLFQSCDEPVANWPLGTWKGDIGEGMVITEHWEVKGDGMIGWGVLEGENSASDEPERLALIKREGNWKYVATVPDQNDGRSVEFDLVSHTKNSWRFENSEHDYPQFLAYELVNKDSLVVRIGTLKATSLTLYLNKAN